MDHEEAVGAEELHVDDMATPDVEKGSLAVNTEDLQPTVEEVPDEADDGTTQNNESFVDEEPDADNEESVSRRGTGATNGVDDTKRGPSVEEEEKPFVAAGSYTDSPRQSFGGEYEAGSSHVSGSNGEQLMVDGEDAGDSSSHHEHEDDVFSDNSPRSSMGSVSEADKQKISPAKNRSTRVSDIPQFEQDEGFVPTVRGTPRPPFRSPSSVQALQMSSPPASVVGSPRSSRRTPRPTVSRLGSPSVSAHYSSKKTPPRFKRNTPPLVLLHVTVMPSRWPWGHVLDNAHPSELSSEGKTLWDSWRQLQGRTGDTIADRGILLPHPQNDYEVLEERLLETLELPLRRRARILECGHYLGPANEMALAEDVESEDEENYDEKPSARQSLVEKTHWCKTCHSNIRYDLLGTGKVFRVKVYASNGLMRAGAWGACWKEMERVDVELEPIIDAKLQEELVHLAAEQERILDMEEEAAADAAAAAVDEELQLREEAEQAFVSDQVEASPQRDMTAEPNSPFVDDRQTADEERLREIYGHGPPPHDESSTVSPQHSEFAGPRESPPSSSVEALERNEERHEEQKGINESASLPELFLEAVKVFLQDQKNLMIGLLSLLVLMLAARSGGSQDRPSSGNMIVPESMAQASVETRVEPLSQANMGKPVDGAWAATEVTHQQSMPAPTDACAACARALEVAEMSLKNVPTSTVELVSTFTLEAFTTTVTETMFETVTVETVPTKAAVIEDVVPEEQSVDDSGARTEDDIAAGLVEEL
ncbi:hypothetical protein C2857_004974 [Epichloe festucae Fl1]|uniref:Pathway-specific nitrogen regulator n=1 Tax=Epichloe festucae (strain Fl1) TaxID=877507 RepID=A0A7U3Q2C5_EPIFF|nr:hypothetical protein C2857_004974 [Epichloe festucae Fl1]